MEKLVVPLDGTNYSTWKLQIRMLLLNLNLWNLVIGSETQPEGAATSSAVTDFVARSGKALSTIVLSVSPSLLYLIGESNSPVAVWRKLVNHFQKSSWANQFALRKELYSCSMAPNSSICDHIRTITQLFDSLSAVCDNLDDKNRVMLLMSSLPSKFDVLITALQSNKDVPSFEELVEKLNAEEYRQADRDSDSSVALLTSQDSKNPNNHHSNYKKKKNNGRQDITCFYCKKSGHMIKDCFQLKHKNGTGSHQRNQRNSSTSSQDKGQVAATQSGFLVSEEVVCGVGSGGEKSSVWILDSGATCHMTNCFSTLKNPKKLDVPVRVQLVILLNRKDIDYLILLRIRLLLAGM